MIFSKEFAYFTLLLYIVFVALPSGILIGLLTSYSLKRMLNETEWRAIPVMLDILMGVVGFLVGTFVSFIGYTENEVWENGELVFRKTTGLGDYYFLIAIIGATIFAAAAHIAVKAVSNKRAKRNNPLASLE